MVSRGASAAALAVLLVIVMVCTSSVMVDAGCPTKLEQLGSCLDAVVTGPYVEPDEACCTKLKDWGMPCLCSVLAKVSSALPVIIDRSKLKGLPGACKISGKC
ncbi:unnamed protein product [Calypogeia fissa]